MTPETSSPSDDGGQLDITRGTAKRLMIWAMDRYNHAVKDGQHSTAMFYDGYIVGIRHLIQSENE